MSIMLRRAIAGTVLVLALIMAPSALAASHPSKHYYVSLGDSLSVGYQPVGPSFAGVETKQGYTNDLRAKYARKIKNLKLVEFGCPKETTGSLLTGKGNTQAATAFHCNRHHGSQLAAAVHFLRAHHQKGEVPLITIDIGANDVDGCVNQPTTVAILACVQAGEQSIKTNTPKILRALRKAAPKGTKLVAMNLYDPVLAGALSSNPQQQQLATESLSLVQGINSGIASADKSQHFKTADVASAFQTYDQAKVLFEGQQVPTDVVRICQLTWMCTATPPNIHANKLGYATIAQAFEKVIGKLG